MNQSFANSSKNFWQTPIQTTKHFTLTFHQTTAQLSINRQPAFAYKLYCKYKHVLGIFPQHTYLQKKQNKRVESLLSILVKVGRDKVFERLRKLEMGKKTQNLWDKQAPQISQALGLLVKSWFIYFNQIGKKTFLSSKSIHKKRRKKWTIKSEFSGNLYTIEKVEVDCDCRI